MACVELLHMGHPISFIYQHYADLAHRQQISVSRPAVSILLINREAAKYI
jgi:hypothetical protein